MPLNSEIVACGDKPLPRSTDVPITVSKSQTELTTSLTNAIFVTPTGPLRHGASRVRAYSSINADAVGNDFGTTSEAYKAARDFCAQPQRPDTFLIGQVFTDPQAGYLVTGGVEPDLSVWTAVTDGQFGITIDGVTNQVTALNFSAVTSLDDVASVVEAGIQAIATGGFTAATVENSGGVFIIRSGTTGDLSTVSVLLPGAAGTDISGADYLNGADASPVPGYAPTTFTNELLLIASAADCSGVFAYGWALDEVYRDAQESEDLAAFTEGRVAIASLTSNDAAALNPDATSDIGPALETLGYQRTGRPEYSDNAQYYPCFAKLANMLAVDYNGENTAKTLKFKNLVGLPTVGVDTTQWTVLQAKGYDTFTRTGNTARTTRNGQMVDPTWYWDERIGLDNYAEEVQTAYYNVLLKNGKLGYNPTTIAKLQDALAPINSKYKRNGLASDRIVETADGIETIPAFQVIIQPLEQVTAAQRVARNGVSTQIIVQLDGAMHTLPIDIVAEA